MQVERVEVKDVRVPENLQRAMAAEAEAARNARAKVIAAEGEHKASRALRHAAEVIVDSPAALQVKLNCHFFGRQLVGCVMVFIADPLLTVCFQLRYLQTLNSISQENNSTIVFPVPIDIISNFMQFQQPPHPDQQQLDQPDMASRYQQYQQFMQYQQSQQTQQTAHQIKVNFQRT